MRRAEEIIASKAVDLLREGKSPEEVKEILPQTKSKEVWNTISGLLKDWNGIDADVSRAAVRAARLKVLSDAIEAKDGELTLRAADQIASDPEVGLKSPPQTTINIDFGPIEDLWKKLEESGNIVEAEYEEIPNEPTE